MFSKVLIANRGEIAVRVITACRELGIQTVAIFSDADKESRHVTLADESWRLDGPPGKVYLDSAQIIDIAKKSGAQAVHPGYGFLSENGDFAEACANASIKFIGPRPDIIRSMGSKVEARRTMDKAGVPVVPGTTDPVTTPEKVKELAVKYGYPVAIKASAGGGGRGLKVVRSESDVESALSSAQREGLSYFGSDEVYVEKYLDNPHHIEVQILGDEHGYVVHLCERDCSSQRRHQKLVEETPAPILKDSVRQKLLQSAVKGATALGYTSAGTLEFLVSGDDYYFLEVNTRVQVEHPITEMVTGIDIVKEQIRVATGEKLSFRQEDVVSRGHSIEFRINAEDPFKNFMPSPGTVTTYTEPRLPWLRIDSACYQGYQILPFYDSLLAKLVVWGRDRNECIARALVALRDYKIEGVSTTIPFHIALMQDATFHAGEVDTKYVEAIFMKRFPQEFGKKTEPKAAAIPSESRVLDNVSAKNIANSPLRNFSVEVNQKQFKVSVSEIVDLDNPVAAQPRLVTNGAKSNGGVANRSIGERSAKTTARSSAQTASTASSHGAQPGSIVAGMHGLVKEVFVKDGDTVKKGGKLLILEAMKMESEVIADQDGKVTSLSVKVGDTVEAGTQFLILS
jgi:acetyl-CoA/propionyl-CoA carboxylase biotin carboxyl carrier protein